MSIRKNKYLTRFDYDRTVGWQFRYYIRGNDKPPDSMFFPDKRHGGIMKALQAAQKYRNVYLKQRGLLWTLEKRKHRWRTECIKHRNNTSGIIGVRLNVTWRRGIEEEAWVAYGMNELKGWHRSFSVAKHGDKKAFHMACEARHYAHGDLALTKRLMDLPYQLKFSYIRA